MSLSIEVQNIVKEAISKPENECIEWKLNNADPQEIGEYVSALANSAALHKKHFGYIIWGISNAGEICGTELKVSEMKVGNQELENWILTQLAPQISFQFYEVMYENKNLVILEIDSAKTSPVRFKDFAYIRIGSYKKKLKDHPALEKKLWILFESVPIDESVIKKNVSGDEVQRLIDYGAYYRMINEPIPRQIGEILHRLSHERIIEADNSGRYNITFNGALLFAANISDFHQLVRKAPRLVFYEGENRLKAKNSLDGTKGYAVGFRGLIKYIMDILPYNEIMKEGIRTDVPLYPEIAIRELIANALIHQDFGIRGAGPLIEVFNSRIEISNPGKPLINTLRFIDEPPLTRNERIADMMRRMGICEERGSGIDKVIFNIELYQLPAPEFRSTEHSTVAILFAPKSFSEMDKDDKIRACYQHACLQYITNKKMSNATLRTRFGIKDESYTQVSRIIRETIDAELIKPADMQQGKKYSAYVPYWV